MAFINMKDEKISFTNSNDDDSSFWESSKNKGGDFFGDNDSYSFEKFETTTATTTYNFVDDQPKVLKQESTEAKYFSKEDLQKCVNALQITPKQESSVLTTDVGSTVSKMIRRQPYQLEQYKTKRDKVALLDAAIKCRFGNVITPVVLFLRRTLSDRVFYELLRNYPDALNSYISYLYVSHNYDDLYNVLMAFDKIEEACILQFKLALSEPSNEGKIEALTDCFKKYFQRNTLISFWSNSLNELIDLLKRQHRIEEEDRKAAGAVSPNSTCTIHLFNDSLISTLEYCCAVHYTLPEQCPSSPLSIRKQYQLSDKQYTWTCFRALLKNGRRWREIDELFQTKTWIGSMKKQCCIGFDKVVEELAKANAPPKEVSKYLALVDNDIKMELANKYNLHLLVIETLIQNKDRRSLEAFKLKLPPNSQAYLIAQENLRSSVIQWKN